MSIAAPRDLMDKPLTDPRSYDAAEDNEISFVDGELITHIEAPSDDWWSGRNPRGEVGLFPGKRIYPVRSVRRYERAVLLTANYVELQE